MRWSDLNEEQKPLLAAWFLLAIAKPPSPEEDLPLEYSTALSELCATVGKYYQRRFTRLHLTPGVVHGQRRNVRVSKSRGQLAT